jgi:hypothetical protein
MILDRENAPAERLPGLVRHVAPSDSSRMRAMNGSSDQPANGSSRFAAPFEWAELGIAQTKSFVAPALRLD